MKIKILSDLHLEFLKDPNLLLEKTVKGDFDVLVIAGDLSDSKSIIDILDNLNNRLSKEDKFCIFVPGNHCYYKSKKFVLDKILLDLKLSNIVVLLNGVYSRDGVTFIGATGWFGPGIDLYHIHALNDFRMIKDIRSDGANNGMAWGANDKQFFYRCLGSASEINDTVICVSHNAPSFRSVNPKYAGHKLNTCFANDWESLIKEGSPEYWIHGHMHDSIEYTLNNTHGNTKVICNPYGYYEYEENAQFNWDYIIEV